MVGTFTSELTVVSIKSKDFNVDGQELDAGFLNIDSDIAADGFPLEFSVVFSHNGNTTKLVYKKDKISTDQDIHTISNNQLTRSNIMVKLIRKFHKNNKFFM